MGNTQQLTIFPSWKKKKKTKQKTTLDKLVVKKGKKLEVSYTMLPVDLPSLTPKFSITPLNYLCLSIN